ncbi:MAG: malto-oligosyltrehalose trehalohydrolase [Actinobacteria bacterium]|nr:malto-oligosyltrehalose trehalohydrolase [Actinomycetota bacterium]
MESWPQLGAFTRGDGVEFRVWAPGGREVAVRVRGRDHPLEPEGEGRFAGIVEAGEGDDYVFVLDGRALPDPCSRFQPQGVRGPSRVVDVAGDPILGVPLDELVLYELHVGTFSPSGTFDGVADRLPELRELGVTAIELMPVATFPGERNWGYDGVYAYAPHPAYGGPEGFARLVAAAHAAGLGVVLDVVYNHIGPGSDAIAAFGPYFTDRHSTFWGDAIDYSQRGVREWAIQNAEMWVRDYGVDGLRLDATHAIFDDSRPEILAELARRVKAIDERVLLVAEMETGDMRPIEQWGLDAQWADELHHLVHVLLTGEDEGYYGDYRPSVSDLARQLERAPAERLVVCAQNHDQVGNRALGDRPATDELRIRAATVLFAPQTPLLFMGEEYGERRPFQFFTDHIDPEIAEATKEGRRREFSRFEAFSGEEVPDPQDPATFERSKLRPEGGDPEVRAFYARMLALRRRLPRELSVDVDEEARTLRLCRGDVELRLDFARREVDLRSRGAT